MAHLDGVVGHRIDHLQPGDDLARGKRLDLEPVVGRLGDEARHVFGGAVDRVEGLREARGQTPFDLGHRLGDRRLGNGGCGNAEAGRLEEFTTFHEGVSLDWSVTFDQGAGAVDRTVCAAVEPGGRLERNMKRAARRRNRPEV